MACVLQVVWPILDDQVPHADMLAEAARQLPTHADKAGATLTGPPVWEVADAVDVPGWESFAPGLVLIGRAPAATAKTMCWSCVVAVYGRRSYRDMSEADLRAAVELLVEQWASDQEIADLLGWTIRGVQAFRYSRKIPGGQRLRLESEAGQRQRQARRREQWRLNSANVRQRTAAVRAGGIAA